MASYSLSVVAAGFKKFEVKELSYRPINPHKSTLFSSWGEASRKISVAANAIQVDTSTSTVSQVIDQGRVNNLLLNGRNAAQLVTLVAGVVLGPVDNADQGSTKTFPTAVTAAVNVSRSADAAFMLDGGNNIDEYTNVNQPFPFPDALQEFSVQTSNYNAE